MGCPEPFEAINIIIILLLHVYYRVGSWPFLRLSSKLIQLDLIDSEAYGSNLIEWPNAHVNRMSV